MAKPIRHRGKWRIRWLDADGKRQSEVFEDYNHSMSAYRSGATARPTVALVVRAKRQIGFAVVLGLFGLFPLLFVGLVTVDCAGTKPEDCTCQVSELRATGRWTRELRLSDLEGIRVDYVDGDKNPMSSLVLVTTGGEIPLGNGSDTFDLRGRRALSERFAAFRSSGDLRFHMTIGFVGLGFGALLMLLCMFGIVMQNGRSVRVVVDPARGAIHVRRWFRTIDLPLSRDVLVSKERDGDGDDVWLLTSPGKRIRLPQAVKPEDILAFHEALEAALGDPPPR